MPEPRSSSPARKRVDFGRAVVNDPLLALAEDRPAVLVGSAGLASTSPPTSRRRNARRSNPWRRPGRPEGKAAAPNHP